MQPVYVRFLKFMLVSGAALLLGAPYAAAQRNVIFQSDSPITSSFFSFNLSGSQSVAVESAMRSALEAGRLGDSLVFKDAEGMSAFYARRGGKPAWVELRGAGQERITSILAVLEESWTHGLNPVRYHTDDIRALIRAEKAGERAHLELLVSDAIIRYGRDLTGMHLPAQEIDQRARYWRTPMEGLAVLEAVAAADTPRIGLEKLPPQDALYRRLRDDLMTLAAHPDRMFEDILPISFGNAILRHGDRHPQVPKLRALMGLTHDPVHGPETRYDDPLSAAVMDFQRRNGLNADGHIGPKTLAVLNRTPRERMEQIIVNMERLRWLGDERPDKYILVNIPSTTMWAVENNEVAFESIVIVGRPQRQTKSFTTEITGVRFNPRWTVPPTIKAQDFLPRLREDPTYLEGRGITVSAMIDGKRQVLDSTAIDWANITRRDLAQMRMTQGAGDDNALGRIRVLMDNDYDIYLHDTNAPSYFNKPDRALSSGCVRVAEPEKMAHFILSGNQGWDEGRMRAILNSGNTRDIAAERPVPVYLLYQTIWLDADGNLIYGQDIYKQDQRLLAAMKRHKSFHIPDAGSLKYASAGADRVPR